MTGNYATPPFITYSIPFFIFFIILEVLVSKRLNKSFYRLNDTIANLTMGIYSQIANIFYAGLITLAYGICYENFKFFEIKTDWGTGFSCFLLVDFLYYWFHRTSHRVAVFWGSHEGHHQSEEYNLSVALRQGALQPLFSCLYYLPLALLGFHPVLFLTCYQFNTIFQFWIHTRALKKLGILEWFLNTPSHHRVHHGINPEYIDKNHAGVLIIWDRLFGTFCEEKKEPVYGTVTPLASFNPAWANIRFWFSLYQLSTQVHGWRNKWNVWWKAPGWKPESMGGPLPVPQVSVQSFVKYDPLLNRQVSLYICLVFVLIVGVALHYFHTHQLFKQVDYTTAVFIFLALLLPARLMEDKKKLSDPERPKRALGLF